MNKIYRRKSQHGAVLPLLAIGMIAIIGVAGLAIDVGHGNLNKGRLQSAVDAAALSGARTLMLTRDTTIATDHATDAFDAHLEGEMSDLDINNLTVQYAPDLGGAYGAGDGNSFFVRVGYSGFNTAYTFASILPGIGGDLGISASAVAGPSPVGRGNGEICDVAPLLMCGDPDGDTDCSDGECFGLNVADEVEYQLKTGSGDNEGQGEGPPDDSGGGPPDDSGGGPPAPDPDPTASAQSCSRSCSVEFDCFPSSAVDADGNPVDEGIGPGNFQLARIDSSCPGGDCVREALAGADERCLSANSTVATEPGNTVGPVIQGLGTRFGDYTGGMSDALYPADPVTTNRCTADAGPDYWYADYVEETNNITTSEAIGRRVIPVPIVACDGSENGASSLAVLGFGCFFLTREMPLPGGQDSYIYGQFLGECEASGASGENPGPVTDDNYGPFEIVLYNDPNPES